MSQSKRLLFATAALAMMIAAPAHATTLVRQGLEDLVATNGVVVLGEVRGVHSYWNAEGSFILTDVHFRVQEVLKGNPKERDLTFTIPGGTVGDLTTLIVGGAELIPGNSYVLFLDEVNLPGARNVRSVREHAQGVFEVRMAVDGSRAVSQATRLPLLPDAGGRVEPPGGEDGMPLASMLQSIRELAGRRATPGGEVK